MTRMVMAVGVVAALAAVACSNPADGKAKAKVSEAKATPEAAKSAGGVVYVLAPETSTIAITASKVTKTHHITVPAWSGTITVPDGKATAATVRVEIDMTQIKADEGGLTRHLQSGDFFETATYPKATFVSTEIREGGDKGATHTIVGNLEMHGQTKAIEFPATVTLGADKVSAKAEFVINRKDWGIEYPGMKDDLIRDSVVITLDLNASAKPAS